MIHCPECNYKLERFGTCPDCLSVVTSDAGRVVAKTAKLKGFHHPDSKHKAGMFSEVVISDNSLPATASDNSVTCYFCKLPIINFILSHLVRFLEPFNKVIDEVELDNKGNELHIEKKFKIPTYKAHRVCQHCISEATLLCATRDQDFDKPRAVWTYDPVNHRDPSFVPVTSGVSKDYDAYDEVVKGPQDFITEEVRIFAPDATMRFGAHKDPQIPIPTQRKSSPYKPDQQLIRVRPTKSRVSKG